MTRTLCPWRQIIYRIFRWVLWWTLRSLWRVALKAKERTSKKRYKKNGIISTAMKTLKFRACCQSIGLIWIDFSKGIWLLRGLTNYQTVFWTLIGLLIPNYIRHQDNPGYFCMFHHWFQSRDNKKASFDFFGRKNTVFVAFLDDNDRQSFSLPKFPWHAFLVARLNSVQGLFGKIGQEFSDKI